MLNLWQLSIIATGFCLIRHGPTIVVSKHGRSNMANIGRFWSSLDFKHHFPRMIQHTKILHMQQQKRDAIEYIFQS